MTVPANRDRGTNRIRIGLALGLGGMAVLHLAQPQFFEPLIPAELGDPQKWNVAATIAEGASAVLLARRRTARLGGILAFATFLVIWVGNFESVRQGGIEGAPGIVGTRAFAIARLPLQLPLLWFAWRIASQTQVHPASTGAHVLRYEHERTH